MISFSACHFGAVSKCTLRCIVTLCNFPRCQTGSIHGKTLQHAKKFTDSRRTFFTWLSKFGTKNHFKNDGMEKRTHDLVYFSPHVNYAVWTQAVCSTSAVLVAAMVSINALMPQDDDMDHYAAPSVHNVVLENRTEEVVMLAAFGAIAMAATYVCRHMVLRLYYNGSKNAFVAVVPNWVPFKVSKMEFASGQMKLVKAATAIQHLRGEYILGNDRYIISKYYFKSPYHYNLMMGYEKPNHTDRSNHD